MVDIMGYANVTEISFQRNGWWKSSKSRWIWTNTSEDRLGFTGLPFENGTTTTSNQQHPKLQLVQSSRKKVDTYSYGNTLWTSLNIFFFPCRHRSVFGKMTHVSAENRPCPESSRTWCFLSRFVHPTGEWPTYLIDRQKDIIFNGSFRRSVMGHLT